MCSELVSGSPLQALKAIYTFVTKLNARHHLKVNNTRSNWLNIDINDRVNLHLTNMLCEFGQINFNMLLFYIYALEDIFKY